MTRIAVLADIHGNTAALLAVLASIEGQEIDHVINLGDIASGAVDPRGTLEVLALRADIRTVSGNHERHVLTLPVDEMGPSDRLAAEELTEPQRAWIAELPTTLEPVPGVLAFHGSPDDDLCYLTGTLTPEGMREATDEEIVERLGAAYGRYALYLCGHTHLQAVRRLPDGSLVVNPGSVGWPAYQDDDPYPYRVEAGTPDARYAIVEGDGGSWSAQLVALAYDHEWAAERAESRDRPGVAHALRTGRVGYGALQSAVSRFGPFSVLGSVGSLR
ncbi:metallophosphoesterase family protein [Antribacter gilvus]|uniref:metallophosphoesterase family protein n=1 Tax=Antribacter gilvus TaxID=2304675 RepID=UPI000F79327D|nr:metallophosphoesterase family protein [Antribacter gilvus]